LCRRVRHRAQAQLLGGCCGLAERPGQSPTSECALVQRLADPSGLYCTTDFANVDNISERLIFNRYVGARIFFNRDNIAHFTFEPHFTLGPPQPMSKACSAVAFIPCYDTFPASEMVNWLRASSRTTQYFCIECDTNVKRPTHGHMAMSRKLPSTRNNLFQDRF
jgi:hypothetical protein